MFSASVCVGGAHDSLLDHQVVYKSTDRLGAECTCAWGETGIVWRCACSPGPQCGLAYSGVPLSVSGSASVCVCVCVCAATARAPSQPVWISTCTDS